MKIRPMTARCAARRSTSQGRLPVRAFFFILSLLSCNGDQKGDTVASATSTTSTGPGSSTAGPATTSGATSTGIEPGVCSDAAPMLGGPCAPYGVIDAGGHHTCTLLFGGKLKCWGYNDYGQLGLGSVNSVGDDETPDAVPPLDLGEAVVQLAAGLKHTCAVTESGRVFCWGVGKLGTLGYGNTMDIGDDELPGSVGPVALDGAAIQVAAGFYHTCALMSDGSVRCWGLGESGRLGTGSTADIGDDETPATQAPIDLGGPAVQIASYRDHTCAVLEGGEVMCWGIGEDGQLGRGNTENIGDDETPGAGGPVDVGASVVTVATGAFHTCALTVAREVRCWGSNGNGPLGSGNGLLEKIGDDEPPSVAGAVSLGRPAIAVTAGGATTCALLDDGTLRCWGGNVLGQLGYGHVDDIGEDDVPSDFGPIEVGGAVAQVSVGSHHVCALLADDSIRCWGEAIMGALGYGNTQTCVGEGGFVGICELGPTCCIADMPGEMPPPPVPYQ